MITGTWMLVVMLCYPDNPNALCLANNTAWRYATQEACQAAGKSQASLVHDELAKAGWEPSFACDALELDT